MSQFGNLSNGVGAVRFAMNPTPLGAAGLVGGMLMGGKGGAKGPTPGYKNGSYTLSDQPYDTSRFSVNGSQGKYDLMPLLGAGNQVKNQIDPSGSTPYNSPFKAAYDSMRNGLGNDQQALQQFDAKFQLPKAQPQYSQQQQTVMANLGHAPVDPYMQAFTGKNYQTQPINPSGQWRMADLVGRPNELLGGWASQNRLAKVLSQK